MDRASVERSLGAENFPRLFSHKEFLDALKDVILRWGEPLSRHTTFKVGGPVACFALPQSLEGLERLLAALAAKAVPWVILGGGSNVLAPDDPWDVMVIQLKKACSQLELLDDPLPAGRRPVRVQVGAGVPLSRLLRFCVQRGLGGGEFLTGIPGTMGGALIMNAGAAGRALSDILKWVEIMDGNGLRERLTRETLPCAYRSMGIPEGTIVLGACLELQPKAVHAVKEDLARRIAQRRVTQPRGVASAGCVFKNPPGLSAGALIDRAGLKGLERGGAKISEKHANWILNTGSATARDILELMEHVEESVLQNFGVRLEREVRVWSLKEAGSRAGSSLDS